VRTLLIDNYDSFTYNLFQLLAEVNGAEPIVVRNDEASWEELAAGEAFDSIVISPGPGRPERERDFGVCAEAIRHGEMPLLGVCLGHQGLGWVHGAQVVRAPMAIHGRASAVEHDGSPLFAGIPSRFEAARYHSLCLRRPLPPDLIEIARSDDGIPMAIAHRFRPQWGVQFHPESIATQHGRRLLANFRDLARARGRKAPQGAAGGARGAFPTQGLANAPRRGASGGEAYELRVRRLAGGRDPEAAFRALYADSTVAFWLDSSRSGPDARFSFMGDASGPLAARVAYDVGARVVAVERGGRTETSAETLFDFLERELRRLRPVTAEGAELPFGFDCGFVGYLGYELKADCGGAPAHSSPHPDAALLFADRLVAFDHERGHTYLLCLGEGGEDDASEAWLAATAALLEGLPPCDRRARSVGGGPSIGDEGSPPGHEPRLARSRERYLEDIAACKEKLAAGESYEVCLTNRIETDLGPDPLDLYLELRRVNPAPYASYLRFGDLAVLSSSPERFLRVDAGVAEAKPIKGTAPRGGDPGEDARLAKRLREDGKSRAENLMIVDLLRNDLGSVCEIGSVEVSALMEVESFETVHQLVSTVRGRLREGGGAVECVRACFPPGSMTGAPKLRTMEIIDELEGTARGIYSGAIGYFGLGGRCDLSVTIRTIVADGEAATIGTGGAIVLQSDAQIELEEILLKARAPMAALGRFVGREGAIPA
jgi:para-aminobenzoate synthetase